MQHVAESRNNTASKCFSTFGKLGAEGTGHLFQRIVKGTAQHRTLTQTLNAK